MKKKAQTIKLKFHKSIYPAAIILKAVKDFHTVGKIILTKKSCHYHVIINSNAPEKNELIKGSFCNYVFMLLRQGL